MYSLYFIFIEVNCCDNANSQFTNPKTLPIILNSSIRIFYELQSLQAKVEKAVYTVHKIDSILPIFTAK